MGYCLVPKRIIENHLEIKYMYKEEPDNKDDSGWRFFEGNESDEFVNNSENIGIYDIKNIIEMDQSLPSNLINLPIGVSYEKIDGKWKIINNDNSPQDERVYFKDKLSENPVHCDCTILEFRLPWNNEILKVYCDYFEIPCYYPIVPEPYHYCHGEYLPDICAVRGYFTKDDLENYYRICESKYQENLRDIKIIAEKNSLLYEEIKKINNLSNKIIITEDCQEINIGLFEISYSLTEDSYCLVKYNDEDLNSRFFWNIDKNFEEYYSKDIDTMIEKINNLI